MSKHFILSVCSNVIHKFTGRYPSYLTTAGRRWVSAKAFIGVPSLAKSIACVAVLSTTSSVTYAAPSASSAPHSMLLQSQVLTLKTAKTDQFEWGTLITYFDKETHGTQDSLTAVAIIKPGLEIHPPHAHAEEEYLMVLSGSGQWTLNGEVFAASSGDMLYAKPWDSHGITNTGSTPLKFIVWKWNSKKVHPQTQPNHSEHANH